MRIKKDLAGVWFAHKDWLRWHYMPGLKISGPVCMGCQLNISCFTSQSKAVQSTYPFTPLSPFCSSLLWLINFVILEQREQRLSHLSSN